MKHSAIINGRGRQAALKSCDIVIIGGNGDLAYRKLYPALFRLHCRDCLRAESRVICLARESMEGDSFADSIRAKLEHYSTPLLTESAWLSFRKCLYYLKADATDAGQLAVLTSELPRTQERDLVIYLATPPSIFSPICKALNAAGLIGENTRVVVEKPLGDNLESFWQINRDLLSVFTEEQVFRIDHYLGKETVQNLLALRFANALFEPLWNSHFIDHVQISVAETVGVEGRWEFYDAAGAARDMLQNHLLQLLCLVAMEPPARMSPQAVRDEKLKVLQSLKPIGRENARRLTVRGQYVAGAVNGKTVPGYCDEDGSTSGSDTESFVAVKAEVMNWRWAGVPFYLRTGKRMMKRCSEIVIHFKHVPHAIFSELAGESECNKLVIRLQPDEGIRLRLLNKVPGIDDAMVLEPVSLDLSFSEAFNNRDAPDAYERLLFDVLRGNPTLFMRADEVEAAWRWVDRITASWSAGTQRAIPYPAGTWGPSESVGLIAVDGRSWYQG